MALEITFISAERLPDALARLEKIIEESFIKAGQAFKEIREGRIYREVDPTFEAYCHRRWSVGRNYVNKLIRSSDIAIELGTQGTQMSEHAVRELIPLSDAEMRKEVVQSVLEKNPNPTREEVRIAVEEKLIQTKPADDPKVQKIVQKRQKSIATAEKAFSKWWNGFASEYSNLPLYQLEEMAIRVIQNH